MLAEFLAKIVELSEASLRPRWVEPNPLLPRVALLSQKDGEVVAYPIAPASRDGTTLDTLGDVVSFVEDQSCCQDPEVYYDDHAVRILTNRGDRHEEVRMHLDRTDRWTLIEKLALAPSSLDVRAASKLLRYQLGAPADVVAALSRVDFVRKSTGSASAEHGRESLGQSVEAAVQQVGTIPVEFSVPVSVLRNFRLEVQVRCSIYVDLQAQRVEVGVYPDEVQRCVDQVVDAVGEQLGAALEDVPVFRGCPPLLPEAP